MAHFSVSTCFIMRYFINYRKQREKNKILLIHCHHIQHKPEICEFRWSVQTPCCCRKGLLQWCPGRPATDRRGVNVRSKVKSCSLLFDVVTHLMRALPWRTQETWLPGRSSGFSLGLEPQLRPSWSGYPTG